MSGKFASFQPLKIIPLSLLASILLTSMSFARPAFLAVESTPYDRQMTRVHQVLAGVDAESTHGLSVGVVDQWMSRVRKIPYRYSKLWQTPNDVNRMNSADCKGKAVLLYEMMHRMGANDVRLVIGRHHAGDWFTHAWLEWDTEQGSYVLDPTFSRRAVRAEQQSRYTYIPLYAYEGGSRFRAQNPSAPFEMPLRLAATGKKRWAISKSVFATQRFAGLK